MKSERKCSDTRIPRVYAAPRTQQLLLVLGPLLGLVLSNMSLAGTFVAFGPQSYTRGVGTPVTVTQSFNVRNPDTTYTLEVYSGGLTGQWQRISSAIITLNGQQVVGPRDFNKNVAVVTKPVTLTVSNAVGVTLMSEPGSGITLQVIGIDNDLPSIAWTINPPPNTAGWNNSAATITFTCSDRTSGVATCPEPVVVDTEGAAQVITRTATDVAGNTASVSVTIKLDRTPPSLALSWPPADNFGTDLNTVEFKGMSLDSVSGVRGASLKDRLGTVTLTSPNFATTRDLDTSIPPGGLWRDNLFELNVFDAADNSSRYTMVVRYTPGRTMIATDPQRTEASADGTLVSWDRAMLRFYPTVSRARIHEIAGEAGGRVGGFLPKMNTALLVFETVTVEDLRNVLRGLKTRTEVDAAIPVTLEPTQVFDNDLLASSERRAYDNIKSSLAAQYIIQNGLPLNPVNVAVIDTGLDATFGQNAEFGGINFINLCTPEGQNGQLGIPVDNSPTAHGTYVTGAIGSDNNGYGNNGLVRGIPGSQFGVTVFRASWATDNPEPMIDGALRDTAMDLILDGTIGQVHVVNMSFGGWASADEQEDYRKYYEGYFNCLQGQAILWVAAAGNDGLETYCNEFFPAGLACSLDNVISVGAYDPDGLIRADFSNYGQGITLSAPGVGVWTPIFPGLYGGKSGTSMAAPLVSGAAALLLAVNPMVPSSVKQHLVETTQPLFDNDLPEGGLDVLGLIQAAGWPDLQSGCFGGYEAAGPAVVPVPVIRQPGLAGFKLNMRPDDWEIWRVQVFARSNSVELEYSGALPTFPKYDWYVCRQELPPGTTFYRIEGVDEYGGGLYHRIGMPGEFPGVPVLTGFNLDYMDNQHHLDRIEVRVFRDDFDQLALEVVFNDDSEHPFTYVVEYALVPYNRIRGCGLHQPNSNVTGHDAQVLDAQHPVLQGFDFDYTHGDEHMDELGAIVSPGLTEVWYNDQNDDNLFSWKVWWVDVR